MPVKKYAMRKASGTKAKRARPAASKAPEGSAFLRLIAELEVRCQTQSKKSLPKLGVRLPKLIVALGTTLSLLDRAASCYWGCNAGDHRGEYLIGRCAVSSHAALNLVRSGYYDEALSVIRSLGEVANLVALFSVEPSKFHEWKGMEDAQRRKRFSAVKVRLALEQGGHFIPIDKDRYATLSSYAIHAGPDNLPQAHNQYGRAVAFPKYQEAGLFLCVNELGIAIAVIAALAPKVIQLPASARSRFAKIGERVIDNVGGLTLDVKGRPWFKPH